jgi:hypothetical protein
MDMFAVRDFVNKGAAARQIFLVAMSELGMGE